MKNNIDDKMKSLAAGFMVPTTEKDLARFSRRLRFYNFFRPRINTLNVYTSVALIGITVGGIFLINNLNSRDTVVRPSTEEKLPVKIENENNAAPVKCLPEIKTPAPRKNIVIKKDTTSQSNAGKDTLKITVSDTIQNTIKVFVKDTVKIKKKIKRTRE